LIPLILPQLHWKSLISIHISLSVLVSFAFLVLH
jgi:hypothetical protein